MTEGTSEPTPDELEQQREIDPAEPDETVPDEERVVPDPDPDS